jgi:hypothetical protein
VLEDYAALRTNQRASYGPPDIQAYVEVARHLSFS